MNIFSNFGIKTKVELTLLIIVLILLALISMMFIMTTVIRETSVVGCKKVPYGPGFEGKCGDGYYAVSILDRSGILRNPEAAPTVGYMICCRVVDNK